MRGISRNRHTKPLFSSSKHLQSLNATPQHAPLHAYVLSMVLMLGILAGMRCGNLQNRGRQLLVSGVSRKYKNSRKQIILCHRLHLRWWVHGWVGRGGVHGVRSGDVQAGDGDRGVLGVSFWDELGGGE